MSTSFLTAGIDNRASSPTSTISSNGPPTPGPASLSSSDASKPQRTPQTIYAYGGIRVGGCALPSPTSKPQTEASSASGIHVARLKVPSSTTNSHTSLTPTGHEPDTPSVYSPQTPMVVGDNDSLGLEHTRSHLGWGEGEQDGGNVSPPAPLAVQKSTEKTKHTALFFHPDQVPKPSFYELEKPYGGTKHFMMAHGLRYYDQDDCDIRREILEQLKEMEWRNRVNTAREDFVRMGEKLYRNANASEEEIVLPDGSDEEVS